MLGLLSHRWLLVEGEAGLLQLLAPLLRCPEHISCMVLPAPPGCAPPTRWDNPLRTGTPGPVTRTGVFQGGVQQTSVAERVEIRKGRGKDAYCGTWVHRLHTPSTLFPLRGAPLAPLSTQWKGRGRLPALHSQVWGDLAV